MMNIYEKDTYTDIIVDDGKVIATIEYNVDGYLTIGRFTNIRGKVRDRLDDD